MKLSIFAIAAISLVEGKEKKVPPRTPPKRLATLRRFADEWTSANMADADLASKWANKLKKHADRMEKKFNRCGFFDPSIKHGGPRPAGAKKYLNIINPHAVGSDKNLIIQNYFLDFFKHRNF